jgi:uridylate kinase
MAQIPYKRVLLKLSGETLLADQTFGIHQKACLEVAHYIQKIQQIGLEVAIVIGGGNIFRGIDLRATGIPRTPADHMGMLATLLNGLAIQQSLISMGAQACVMSALECPSVAETYNWSKALKYLADGTILIFVGGTGNPYFTTDTAAALRASEIHADILLKATKVDGIYNKDPLQYFDAIKYEKISYSQMLAEKLKVMDATAIALCRSSQIPIFVFNMQRLIDEDIEKLLTNLSHGTLVEGH